ncbi:LxmA leader domain family RiPP [Streptomyces sp. NPDC050423]|uniref:LxmA leader domain family RiPP n=1 Tax=Streptomyces sp. NPDC050423 TaxID=3155402 RepID=UPI0034478059
MSTQALMSGFAAYTDAEELAATTNTSVAEQQSPITISIISIASVVATYESGC